MYRVEEWSYRAQPVRDLLFPDEAVDTRLRYRFVVLIRTHD